MKNNNNFYNDEFWEMIKRINEYQNIIQPLTNRLEAINAYQEAILPFIRKIYATSAAEISHAMVSSLIPENMMKYLDAYQSLIRDLSPVMNRWQMPVNVVAAFRADILSTCCNIDFARLLEAEKTIAGLSAVTAIRDNITSITLQVASVYESGLTQAWQEAVAPSAMLQQLNSFAIKQYELIEKSNDSKDIDWRLGLIDVASAYVDERVSMGTALAIETEQEAPEIKVKPVDLSELPVLLSSAKRDDRDIEEVYDGSQMKIILDTGKLIYQKAKVINDCCRMRNRSLLFSESKLAGWMLELVTPFSRDEDSLIQIMDVLHEMFVREEIIELTGDQKCFSKIESFRNGVEGRKGDFTKKQKKIYQEIVAVEDIILEKISIELPMFSEENISPNVYLAMLNIQKNKIYIGKDENTINDGIRDQLKLVYKDPVGDQSRQGTSESGKDAGELDIVISDQGNPVAILEGMKLSYCDKKELHKHLSKVLVNYNPTGCPLCYVMIYFTGKDLVSFWDKLLEYIKKEYHFPYECCSIEEINASHTESRRARVIMSRSGKEVRLLVYVIALREK